MTESKTTQNTIDMALDGISNAKEVKENNPLALASAALLDAIEFVATCPANSRADHFDACKEAVRKIMEAIND